MNDKKTKRSSSKVQTDTFDLLDIVRMQTEVALIESMTKSKTLTAMVIIGVVGFSGFFYFLFKMASV